MSWAIGHTFSNPSLQLLLTSSSPLQPLSFARARACLSPRTCNGFENYVRRVRQRGSAQAGRAEGLGTAPSGSSAPPSSHIDEVAPRWAEQQGTVLRHLVAARPLAPSSSTWTQTTSGDDSSAAPQQACLLCSSAKMIASAPPVPISPISGHTGEAEWSRRDIPVAVSLGTELRGSSFGGAMK